MKFVITGKFNGKRGEMVNLAPLDATLEGLAAVAPYGGLAMVADPADKVGQIVDAVLAPAGRKDGKYGVWLTATRLPPA